MLFLPISAELHLNTEAMTDFDNEARDQNDVISALYDYVSRLSPDRQESLLSSLDFIKELNVQLPASYHHPHYPSPSRSGHRDRSADAYAQRAHGQMSKRQQGWYTQYGKRAWKPELALLKKDRSSSLSSEAYDNSENGGEDEDWFDRWGMLSSIAESPSYTDHYDVISSIERGQRRPTFSSFEEGKHSEGDINNDLDLIYFGKPKKSPKYGYVSDRLTRLISMELSRPSDKIDKVFRRDINDLKQKLQRLYRTFPLKSPQAQTGVEEQGKGQQGFEGVDKGLNSPPLKSVMASDFLSLGES